MCVNPYKGFVNELGEVIKVASPLATYVKYNGDSLKVYYDIPSNSNKRIYSDYIDIPCRNCIECYEIQRIEWSTRAVCEAQYWSDMCFLTLTYDDSHLKHAYTTHPDTGEIFDHPTLCHRDFQLFLKRLRKYFNNVKIRFFMCGEYGSRTFRPHYHCVIYGLNFKSFGDLSIWNGSNPQPIMYRSSLLETLWQNGLCTVQECEIATIRYVAGYVDKKLGSEATMRKKEFYYTTGLVAPYIRSSLGLGIS